MDMAKDECEGSRCSVTGGLHPGENLEMIARSCSCGRYCVEEAVEVRLGHVTLDKLTC